MAPQPPEIKDPPSLSKDGKAKFTEEKAEMILKALNEDKALGGLYAKKPKASADDKGYMKFDDEAMNKAFNEVVEKLLKEQKVALNSADKKAASTQLQRSFSERKYFEAVRDQALKQRAEKAALAAVIGGGIYAKPKKSLLIIEEGNEVEPPPVTPKPKAINPGKKGGTSQGQ